MVDSSNNISLKINAQVQFGLAILNLKQTDFIFLL